MQEILGASTTNLWRLIVARAEAAPDALALIEGDCRMTYAQIIAAANRIAADLVARGVGRGDRVAVLSENCLEYALTQLACAKLGAMVACLNWRLVAPELAWCIELVQPRLLLASDRHRDLARAACPALEPVDLRSLGRDGDTTEQAQAEDGFIIIYTSGTTGRPKAAVISQRAQIARMCAFRLDLGLTLDDGYISRAPMFHMGGTEHLFSTLLIGGTVTIMDGFQTDAIMQTLREFRIGWLMTIPATTELLLDQLRRDPGPIKGVRVVGAMADMTPAAVIDEVTRLLNAPYLNSFGATETGMPPLSGDLIQPGTMPRSLAKKISILTELRLVGPDGQDVAPGETGEAWVRGPTLFSGYWNADQVNRDNFSGGWFHMGDLFRRSAEGYEFAGRSKYLIKSGGENIYPAEIERVILADPRVADAIVVRRPDDSWGEAPVAVIARSDDTLDEDQVIALCRANLAGYKRPKGVVFIPVADFPRSTSGKIIREDVEIMVRNAAT
ncbi:AMP-binding protein [Paracoccus sp. DMF-8]|uniref:class I adenylate-forming enzyme family protein n=1 Tax=Paracoccus sp. DMF-8 TaxID=3019445 RepID=UPI0023E41F84|nr:AMP-binding protein [Paracoccus sp. DMF-8]MDF3608098.1 AMP-binding protein [Paracoccus sp. DMF-8]